MRLIMNRLGLMTPKKHILNYNYLNIHDHTGFVRKVLIAYSLSFTAQGTHRIIYTPGKTIDGLLLTDTALGKAQMCECVAKLGCVCRLDFLAME